MVSLPDFDPEPSRRARSQPSGPDDAKERIFNQVTLGDYEIGSVFKIFNTAMALDSGSATMTAAIDATNPIQIGRFTIHDYHGKHRWLSVPEIFMYSSNIGSAKMALDAGGDRQREFLAPARPADAEPSFELERDRQAALPGARGARSTS